VRQVKITRDSYNQTLYSNLQAHIEKPIFLIQTF